MKTFDQSLFELYEAGMISYEDALRNADSKNEVRLRIKLESKREIKMADEAGAACASWKRKPKARSADKRATSAGEHSWRLPKALREQQTAQSEVAIRAAVTTRRSCSTPSRCSS